MPHEEHPMCPTCEGEETEQVGEEDYDGYDGYEEKYHYVCDFCDCKFTITIITRKVTDEETKITKKGDVRLKCAWCGERFDDDKLSVDWKRNVTCEECFGMDHVHKTNPEKYIGYGNK